MQIVTIHKSKGLEYPLVFLPFICSHRAADTPPVPPAGGGQSHRARSHRCRGVPGRGRQRPRRRLACALRGPGPGGCATWLGLAPVRSGAGKSEKTDLHRTAIGYLLQREEGRRDTGDRPHRPGPGPAGVAVGEPSLTRPAPTARRSGDAGEPTVRAFQGQQAGLVDQLLPGLAAQGNGHGKGCWPTPASTTRWPPRPPSPCRKRRRPPFHLHLPQGGRVPGTLLHSLFETIDFEHAGASRWHSTSPPC